MALSQVSLMRFGLIVLGVATAGSAVAGERVQIPYDCRFDGVRVHLRPSPAQTYEVIGPREREIFNTCSPRNPDRCRSWFIHRFELDCNGARVGWLDVAAAASRYTRQRAWVRNGRFQIRMGRGWTVGRGGPPIPPGDEPPDFYEPSFDSYGDESGYRTGRSRVVTLPPGFAPALGIPMSFVGDEGPSYAGPAGTFPGNAVQVEKLPALERIPDLPVKADRTQIPIPKPVVASTSTEAPAPTSTGSITPAIINAPELDDDVPAKPKASAASSVRVTPATNVATATEPPTLSESPSPTEPPSSLEPPTLSEALPSSEPSNGPRSDKPSGVTSSRATPALSAVLPDAAVRSPSTTEMAIEPEPLFTATTIAISIAVFIFAGLCLWLWGRRSSDIEQITSRDIGAVSLSGPGTSKALTLSNDAASEATPPNKSDAEPKLTGGVEMDLEMPTTLTQALEILGASADTSRDTIKKIVDGLRQSWHPDLAKSDKDRAVREQRLRQINVAWDLVARRFAA